jgi:fructose-bisphosphate aldolase class II
MYVKNTKEILDKANTGYYGVGAFNVNNLEFIQGIIFAAIEKSSPVIIETSEGAMAYAGGGDFKKGAKVLADMVRRYADDIPAPVALHLDHGHDLDHVLAAIRAGYTSVMIDASAKPFEENLQITSEVVKIAHAAGISVEAELGKLVGMEDNVSVAQRDATLVDPDEAKIFVDKTGVDFLAPAIGTSHGAFKFKGEAKLDFDRLARVKSLTKIPLVLHGASSVLDTDVQKANAYGAKIEGAKGVPYDVIKQAIKYGINKINTDTDLRIAFLAELRKVLHDKPSEIDPRDFFKPATDAVKNVVAQRMDVLGSSGKA